MRAESLRRTFLLVLITCIVPSLILASSWAPQLYDLILPLGGPASHIAEAILLYALMFVGYVAASAYRVRLMLARSRPVWPP